MRVINYMGANGVGKSTRTFYLVEFLQSQFDHRPYIHFVERKGKDPKEEVVGTLFSNGWLVLGKYSKNKTQWVSLDSAIFSKWEFRLQFMEHCSKDKDIEVLFMEGYFNNRSVQTSPDNLKKHGATNVTLLSTYYDDIQDFIKRTNGRTGKERGLDWAENSAGWKDNSLFWKIPERIMKDFKEGDEYVRIVLDAPRDILVQMFFDNTFTLPEKKKEIKGFL